MQSSLTATRIEMKGTRDCNKHISAHKVIFKGNQLCKPGKMYLSMIFLQEFILYPWRFSQRQHSNAETLQSIGEYAARQSRLPDGRLYEVTNINI